MGLIVLLSPQVEEFSRPKNEETKTRTRKGAIGPHCQKKNKKRADGRNGPTQWVFIEGSRRVCGRSFIQFNPS